MKNKEYSSALDSTIEWLEGEQATKRELLSERFREGYDSLKPINLIKSTVKDWTAAGSCRRTSHKKTGDGKVGE